MTYMNHQTEFAPAGGIQELSFDEVEQVDGGLVPAIIAFAATPAGQAAIRVGAAVVTIAVLATIDYISD